MCNSGLKPVPCETSADCGAMMCCGHWHHGPPQTFDSIACEVVCMAAPANPATNDGEYQLCDTGQSDCLPPSQCVADARLGGGRHGYCKP